MGDEAPPQKKAPTGIEGFDEIARGGLPVGRTTVVLGAPGTGKTVFALQSLVNGIRDFGEPGVFVAFEEDTAAIAANAAGFGWDIRAMETEDKLRLLDARLAADTLKSGDFDLAALLATILREASAIGARRVVLDAVDVLLTLLQNPVAEHAELYRIYDWLAAQGLTGLLTIRSPFVEDAERGLCGGFSFVQYMADCVVLLRQTMADRVAGRNLRILKYRGSGFSGNEYPIVIGDQGFQLVGFAATERRYQVSDERISTGIGRLDTMLAGGYYRGTTILVSGAPGTAKTTLGGTFTDAACRRGERVVFVSFDEDPTEIVRNQASVNIHLQGHADAGLLRLVDIRSETRSADEHLAEVKSLVLQYGPDCMVVDPLSAMLRSGGRLAAMAASVELIQFAKSRGITLLCTSLTAAGAPAGAEEAELRISTIADTWIQLSFAIQGGERNRALTIIKSRGTGHSNQVRELVLSAGGVDISDVYSAGGEVLMGTLRLEKEMSEQYERERLRRELKTRERELQLAEARIQAEIGALQVELDAKRVELELIEKQTELHERQWSEKREQVEAKRRADVNPTGRTD